MHICISVKKMLTKQMTQSGTVLFRLIIKFALKVDAAIIVVRLDIAINKRFNVLTNQK